NPAVQIDLPGRRLYLFGSIFTASDTIFLLLLLLFLAFSLFFFTSLFGRVWCGYACPQTVFLDAFVRPIEEWIEGPRAQRMKLDKAPWSPAKVARKGAKWLVFALLAIVVAATFGSFFTGAVPMWTGTASGSAYFVTGVFAVLWFLDFVWFREQFCNYLCPYARFQSALADQESLTITYDLARAEPRGGADARTAGRCIECNKCVAVCPQGIDIRDGFQLECIACAACIDACDSVMTRIGHTSLVTYGSLAAQEGRKVRILRPRTVVYGGLLTALTAAGVVLAVNRTPIEAQVSRVRGSLFQVDADGWVRNTYMLRITNTSAAADPIAYTVNVEGLKDAQVTAQPVQLASTESRVVPLVVRIPPVGPMVRTMPIKVRVASPDASVTLDATFKTPGAIDDAHPDGAN
ncbi:MAG: cytochrome c oxidase accessory protein CcoG, partial [Gemmatimonadales bacterium]|nr:cytochrome c oxidase accessory protein CcoG [Gemmatimonadales bacterium]